MFEIRRTAAYERWIKRLKDRVVRAQIAVRVDRLAAGNPGDVKAVGNGVSELRIHYGPGYRVYFVQKDGAIIMLLCGGEKSSQDRDIEFAKKLAQGLEE